jgi:hypothetical protein
VVILVQGLILALGLDHRFFASEQGLLSVSISEIVAYAVLGVMLMEVLRGRRWGVPLALGSRVPGSTAMGVYLSWIALAAAANWFLFSNPDGLHSLKDGMPGLILFGAIRFWVRNKDDLRRVVNGVALTLLLLSALAISQFVFGGPHLNPIQDNAYDKFAMSGENRVSEPVVGTFASPNSFAVFFAPLFLLCLTARAEFGRSRVGWAALGVMGVALLLTQAKLVVAVTFLTAICAISFTALRVRPRGSIAAGVLLSTLTMMCLAIVVLLINEAALPAGLTMGTMRGRLGLAAEGIHLLGQFSDVAWFGGGIDLYRELMPISFHVHNEYIAQALMWGIPGAVLFTWILIRACWAGKRVLWTTKLPVIATALILLVESGGGTQRAGMLFLIVGISMFDAGPEPVADFGAAKWS